MTDQTPAQAREPAPVELNLVALGLIGVVTLAEFAAVALGRMRPGVATAIAGNAVTGLFAIINRGRSQ